MRRLRACLILLVGGARAQGRQAAPGLRPVRVAQRRPRARPALTQEPSDSEDATCYGRRYPDLEYAFCKDECNVQALHRHFQDHGRREGRRFGCEAAPLTAAETAKWKVHEARLRVGSNPVCAALQKDVAAGAGRCRDGATWCSAQGNKACWPKAACGVCDASSAVCNTLAPTDGARKLVYLQQRLRLESLVERTDTSVRRLSYSRTTLGITGGNYHATENGGRNSRAPTIDSSSPTSWTSRGR